MGRSGALEASPSGNEPWWDNRLLLLALVLGSIVPLLYPPVPPLVDLMGHMGRYRVELDLAHSEWLQRYYSYRWAAIGNLGVDLLVRALGPLIGLELAVKLIVLSIPPLTVAGFLWVAREVHGRIPPTALFAIPFVYGHPFLFGFVNFTLSMALAFIAFAFWLRLARTGRTRLRAILFVPISVIIFFCHTYGWGALGLLCFSAEAVRQHDRGIGWLRAGWTAALHASVMALPVVIMLAWRSETHGGMTSGWFDWDRKLIWLYAALRDRWQWFDVASVGLAAAVIVFALAKSKLTFSRNLAFSGLVLLAAFLAVPWTVFGSAYADMRLAPYLIAVLLIAIRFRGDVDYPLATGLAVAALLFFAVRLVATTASLAIASNDQQAKLEALDHLPTGARVVSLVTLPCANDWPLPRDTHLGGMVIVRREGFSNDQWAVEGANLLGLRYTAAGAFAADPSQIVRDPRCARPGDWTVERAIRAIPRGRFDYLWLINPPPHDPKLLTGMHPVWRATGSILYRINP